MYTSETIKIKKTPYIKYKGAINSPNNQFYLGYSLLCLEQYGALFTAQEISHQPHLWRQLYKELSNKAEEWRPFLLEALAKPDLQIVLCGAGSSGFVGKTIAPWLRQHSGLNTYSYAVTDIVAAPKHYLDINKPTLLVSYARSGNSPESLGVIALADELLTEVYHLTFTCNSNGALACYTQEKNHTCSLIMPDSSHDKGFAMTSSFSCMLLATLLLFDNQNFSQLGCDIEEIATLVENAIPHWLNIIQPIVKQGFNRVLVLGSNCFTGIAEEGALKVLELTSGKVVTRFDSTLGVRHGPKLMIDEETLVVVMLSVDEYCRRYDIDLLNELGHEQKAKHIVALSSLPLPQAIKFDCQLNDIWLMFPYLVFLQLLAFESSLNYGISPDNPCPTGEVNRVVKGVQIYPYK
ncbi:MULTISPECIES: SIS domain-containing protein [Providencia]|uniref:SIS domain-containing protein n=1 Tax=Providencia TaxID=586 RepID=UPI00300D49DC